MKICLKCGLEYDRSFDRCKPCKKKYDAGIYVRKRPLRRAQLNAYRFKSKQWVTNFKKNGVCTDCGNNPHPAAMHFDHLPGYTKVGEISELVKRGSLERVKREMAKCELVCANCHAIRTYTRAGWDGKKRVINEAS